MCELVPPSSAASSSNGTTAAAPDTVVVGAAMSTGPSMSSGRPGLDPSSTGGVVQITAPDSDNRVAGGTPVPLYRISIEIKDSGIVRKKRNGSAPHCSMMKYFVSHTDFAVCVCVCVCVCVLVMFCRASLRSN